MVAKRKATEAQEQKAPPDEKARGSTENPAPVVVVTQIPQSVAVAPGVTVGTTLVVAQGLADALPEPASDSALAEDYIVSRVNLVAAKIASHGVSYGLQPCVQDVWKALPIGFEGIGSARSYKHPFDPKMALQSIAENGIYESSGCVPWCNVKQTSVCDDPKTTMGEVKRCALVFTAATLAAGQPARIIFPISVPITTAADFNIGLSAFKGTLPVLTGHAYIQAWWYLMDKALLAAEGNDPDVTADVGEKVYCC